MLYAVGDYRNESPTKEEYDSFICEIILANDYNHAWWKGAYYMSLYGRKLEWLMEIKDLEDAEHWIKRMEDQRDDF
jgi:hypothetical protein